MIDPLVTPSDVLGDEPAEWPLTIGVALPIPEPFLGELGAYRERFGDPMAHAIVAHITLVPPTQVPDEDHLWAVIRHLQAQAADLEPFPLALAGSGTFRPVSPVVFVPIVQGEQEVRRAEAAVRRGPLDRRLLFPYHPHVTVAHNLDEEWLDQAQEVMAPYRAAFEVTSLGLFVQGGDGVWRQRVEFPFGAGASRTLGEVEVAEVGADELGGLCDRLGEILAESVQSGAGVNFLLPFTAADGAAWWRSLIPDVVAGRRTVLVARIGTEVVGTVSLTPASAPNQPHRAEVSKLLVAGAHRRRRVATRLMADLAELARSCGLTLLTLDCVAGGPEEDFYRGVGFTAIGTIPGYALSPAGDPQGATFLYRQLA